jgi:phytoene synthase
MAAAESFALAAESLRASDRDRYLATLVLPTAKRNAITALYAFNADVAGIRERVSNPAPGEIRLQWWVDALEGVGHGEVRKNPAADALLSTSDEYNLPSGTLLRLLGARRFDLYDDPMPDLESFEGYAGETASTLYQLAAMILNDGEALDAGDAAGHLGVAHALIGHLRSFGYHASQGRIMLPWSIFAANGATEADIFAGAETEGVVTAIGQVTELAADHLSKAEAAIATLTGKIRPAFAQVALLRAQLERYKAQQTNVYAVAADDTDWRKIMRLMLWSWRNR